MLRPLGVGDVLDRTFTVYRSKPLVFIGLSAIWYLLLVLVFVVLAAAIFAGALAAFARQATTPSPEQIAGAAVGIIGFVLVAVVVAIVLFSAQSASLVDAAARRYLAKDVAIGESFRAGLSASGRLFIAGVLVFLATAVQVVIKAGAMQLAGIDHLHVEKKGAIDLVTQVDRDVERMFRALIAERFPDHQVLAEEMGGSASIPPGPCWVFDPIDGTTNYAHGLPIFCASLALEVGGVAEVAAIYGTLFARNDPMWEASLAAFLNDAVLRLLSNRERNQFFLLREQSDMLELAHPGAPARARVKRS